MANQALESAFNQALLPPAFAEQATDLKSHLNRQQTLCFRR